MAIEKQVVYSSKQLMVVYIWIGVFMFNFRILHPLLTDQYQFSLSINTMLEIHITVSFIFMPECFKDMDIVCWQTYGRIGLDGVG